MACNCIIPLCFTEFCWLTAHKNSLWNTSGKISLIFNTRILRTRYSQFSDPNWSWRVSIVDTNLLMTYNKLHKRQNTVVDEDKQQWKRELIPYVFTLFLFAFSAFWMLLADVKSTPYHTYKVWPSQKGSSRLEATWKRNVSAFSI
jgi:hypothetical protein